MFGKRPPSSYLAEGRLADVLALIQVLALDEKTHRSEDGLASELQGPPRSAQKWPQIAERHPEFFRVRPLGEHRVSLVARHVAPSEEDSHPPLSTDYTSKAYAPGRGASRSGSASITSLACLDSHGRRGHGGRLHSSWRLAQECAWRSLILR